MIACFVCLELLPHDENDYIRIFSEVGLRLEIGKIIAKHLWLQPEREKDDEYNLCLSCWDALQSFHTFYLRVAAAHNYLEANECPKILIDDDVIPQGIVPKSESKTNIESIQIDDSDFFDAEIKVEVNDLDLLPQTEVIEEDLVVSGRASRANRRSQAAAEKDDLKKAQTNNENQPEIKNESDTDLLVASFFSEANTEGEGLELLKVLPTANDPTAPEPQKKKRGRPRKIKDNDRVLPKEKSPIPVKEAKSLSPLAVQPEISEDVKCESDNEEEAEFLAERHETEDSESSSSENNNSEDSWHDSQEKYAEIPKRVVVRPKKYRKREKPPAPVKRLSREELERKRLQQAEYDETIAKFFDKFSCPNCNLLVQNFGAMKAHFRISHKDESGYMSCCGKKFHLRKNLAEHILVHWNPEHFKCSMCSKIFLDFRSLELHMQSHLNPNEQKEKKLFSCEKCPKTFTTKAAFEYHSYSKHVPKSEFKFSCPECNKKLPTSRKLKDHIKYAHDPESTVICDKCGKQLRNQSSLKKHHEIEHSDKPRPVPDPMQCEICGTWLRHAAGLKQHMKTIHEDPGGEHRCHICNKTSTNARALKRHIYHNHECERKFKCTMCEKAFKRPQDLREHTSTHTGEVLYTCPNCPMTFFSNANMYKHRQRLHRAEWEADRKKPRPPNIMGQAISATAAMKMKQAVGAANAFFDKVGPKIQQKVLNGNISIEFN